MIIDPVDLLLFATAALALNLTPGADMMFCLGQGLKSGPKAGLAASLGISTGSAIHTLMAAFGLAALIAAHPVAFEVLRWAGVIYLVWLAIQTLRQPLRVGLPQAAGHDSVFDAWRGGTLVNLLNPKVIVFTLAFIPQFVDPVRGSTVLQFLQLGLILNIGGTIVNGAVGVGAGAARGMFVRNRWVAPMLSYASSAVFLGLAARLAFDRR